MPQARLPHPLLSPQLEKEQGARSIQGWGVHGALWAINMGQV